MPIFHVEQKRENEMQKEFSELDERKTRIEINPNDISYRK